MRTVHNPEILRRSAQRHSFLFLYRKFNPDDCTISGSHLLKDINRLPDLGSKKQNKPPRESREGAYGYRKWDSNPHSLNGQGILSPPCLPFHHSCIRSRVGVPNAKLIKILWVTKFFIKKMQKRCPAVGGASVSAALAAVTNLKLFLFSNGCFSRDRGVVVEDADCNAVPAFFLKHVSYAETFSLDSVGLDAILVDEHVLYRLSTLVGEAFVDFDRTIL